MPATKIEASIRHRDGVAFIDLTGDIDAGAEQELSRAYSVATDDGTTSLVLNFEDVGYINSTGIALIVNLLARARASHRRLLACGLSEHYMEIFRITRLADFMSVFPDEASALTSVEDLTA